MNSGDADEAAAAVERTVAASLQLLMSSTRDELLPPLGL